MPRIFLSENQRLNARLSSWIYGEMKYQKIPQRIMAQKMNISQQALSQKLKNCTFSFDDFLTIVRILQPDTKELERLVGR